MYLFSNDKEKILIVLMAFATIYKIYAIQFSNCNFKCENLMFVLLTLIENLKFF